MDTMHCAMLGMAVTAALFSGAVVLYQWIRSHFPVKVNCHFCNTDSKVPYGNKTCWDCPNCEQYNGFTKDGDYNKDIPAQYNGDLNHPVTAESRRAPPAADKEGAVHSPLCDKCSKNQILKVKQLAHFVARDEANYDAEVEAYQSHLEFEYRLCRNCEQRVSRTLSAQDSKLQRDFDMSDLSFSGADLNTSSFFQPPSYSRLPEFVLVRALRCLVVLLAMVVLCCDTHSVMQQSDKHIWDPDSDTEELEVDVGLIPSLYARILELALTGLCVSIASVCIAGKERLNQVDALGCLLWTLVLVVHSPTAPTKLDKTNLLRLQTAVSFLTVTVAVYCAVIPRYLKAASPKRIHKRSLRRNLRCDSSGTSNASFESFAPPAPPAPPAPLSAPPSSVHSGAGRAEENRDVFTAPLPPAPRREEPPRPPPTPQLDELAMLRLGTPVRDLQPRRNGGFMFDFPHQPQPAPGNQFNSPHAAPPPAFMATAYQPRPIISPAKFTPVLTRDRLVTSSTSRAPSVASLQTHPGHHHNGFVNNATSHLRFSRGPASDPGGLNRFTQVHRRHGEGQEEDSSRGSESSHSRAASSVCPVGTTSYDTANKRKVEEKPGWTPWLLWALACIAVVSITINILVFARVNIAPTWFNIDFSTFLFS